MSTYSRWKCSYPIFFQNYRNKPCSYLLPVASPLMEHNETLSSSAWEATTWSPLKKMSKQFVLMCVPVLFALALVNNALVLYAFGWPRRTSLHGAASGAASVHLYYLLLAAADMLVLAPFAYFMLGMCFCCR